MRAAGDLFLTAAVVLALFLAYQMWWTNLTGAAEASAARQTLEHQWSSAGRTPAPPRHDPVYRVGQRFGLLYLPRLGQVFPIAEGTDKRRVLDQGFVGHVSGTAMPQDPRGNFVVAAHRNTHGEPFRRLLRLGDGDDVVVETASTYYTYRIEGRIPQTSPDNGAVLDAVPGGSPFGGPGRYITLITCTPDFTSWYRFVLFGRLTGEEARGQGRPAAISAFH